MSRSTEAALQAHPAQIRVYQLLDGYRSLTSRIINLLLMLLIFLNVVAVLLESVESVARDFSGLFFAFELFSVGVFSIEYALRAFSAPANPEFAHERRPRLAFVRSGMAIVDLLAIAPFYLGMLVGIDARALRALRLVRVFKLTRYSSAMELLATVVRRELPNISSALFVMTILIVLAASGIYVVEREVQPDHFGSIPAALWWATVTLSTVGYGDVVPATAMGKAFGMMLMVIGVGMAALPAGILASGYSRELSSRRERYEAEVDTALSDGLIDDDEAAHLDRLREELGIRQEETKHLRSRGTTSCPHCGKRLA